jgi:hypothetical protein
MGNAPSIRARAIRQAIDDTVGISEPTRSRYGLDVVQKASASPPSHRDSSFDTARQTDSIIALIPKALLVILAPQPLTTENGF